jgi:L-lactate dehydrogenase complex protein LldG
MLMRVRAGLAPTGDHTAMTGEGGGLSSMSKIFLKMYGRVARYPKLFALSQKFAWLGTFLISPFSQFVQLPALTGWGYSKDLPRFAGKTFRERWQVEKQVNKYASRQGSTEKNNPVEVPTSIKVDTDRAERFITELTKVNGNVIQTNRGELTTKVMEFLQARGIDAVHLEPNVLDEKILSDAGIRVSHEPDAAIRAGVTKAICGLADTGSILEADGEGGKLQASLLTEIHLAVLKRSDIYPSMNDAIHLTRGTRSAVFITGPSRTADIEMTLTIGVHGPGELHVLLVDG